MQPDHQDNRNGPWLRAEIGLRDQRNARNWKDNSTAPKAAQMIQSIVLLFRVEDKSESIE